MELPEEQYQQQLQEVLDKECLCVGLSNAAAIQHNLTLVKNMTAVNVCPGPNIVYFSKIVSLQTMTDHIYGRTNLLEGSSRPHLLIKELELYLDYLEEQLKIHVTTAQPDKQNKYYDAFCARLYEGIDYYRQLHAAAIITNNGFLPALDAAGERLQAICTFYNIGRHNAS